MRGTYDVKLEAVFGLKVLRPRQIHEATGIYEVNLGAKPRPALNCVNCGAPHQAGDRCEYCLTGSEAMP